MRDFYTPDGSDPQMTEGQMVQMPSGMRHSIRPRRAVLEQAQKRKLAQAFEAERSSGFVSAGADLDAWDTLEIEEPGARRALSSAMPVVDSSRTSPTARAFDLLRTRLRQTTQEHGWRNIAVTAPTTGCGNTFTAVNLALSLSRVPGSRTVLMDMNLRSPGVARAFDMTARGSIRSYLAGDIPLGNHMIRASETLALGLNEAPDANPSETLQDSATGVTLHKMRQTLSPELVIYDMPPMLGFDDVSAFLPQLDGVLLVSDGTQTMARQLRECERMLDGQVPLLGVVLNRARKDSIAA
ncbi:MAG: CpsD/CapB family tyrosine-protein kinase [Pseudomonadota bacterium]